MGVFWRIVCTWLWIANLQVVHLHADANNEASAYRRRTDCGDHPQLVARELSVAILVVDTEVELRLKDEK